MTFKVIDGGGKTPEDTKEKLKSKSEQLKIFVSHMRTLESSITAIRTIASKVGWQELDTRLIACHKTIIDTLSFVKNSSKAKNIQVEEFEKPAKPKYLKVIDPED